MIPGYNKTKGYPFEVAISKKRFIYRLNPAPDAKGIIKIFPNKTQYPIWKGVNWFHDFFSGKLISFLMHRIYDYDEALKAAEEQIDAILREEPFLPEDFGFIKAVGPQTIHDVPVTVYISKHNEDVSVFREIEKEITDNSLTWILMRQKENGEFYETRLFLPCHRIAYAAFHALGVEIEEESSVADLPAQGEQKTIGEPGEAK